MKSSTIRVGLFPLLAVCVAGCGGAGFHSPTIDVLGSYFPAWMICMLTGLALTLIARFLLAAFKLDTCLRPAPIVYICLMVVFTMVVWLTFFKN
jgi:hypothetical protein